MVTKQIARGTAAVVMGLAAHVVAPVGASANSTYKAGLTEMRVTETFPGPWTVANRTLPPILLTNDTVLLRDPTLYWTQQFLPKMIAGPVTIEQRLAAGKLLEEAGMLGQTFDVGSDAGPFAPGSSTTVIELSVSGIDRRIVVPALGSSAANLPKLTAAQRANRAHLAKVMAKLVDPAQWKVKSTSAFRPTQYSAWGMRTSLSPTFATASTFDLSSFTSDAPTCIAVAAKQAEAMPPAAQQWLSWRGVIYNVVVRPTLPGETVCAAIR
jgi:hypothetical protein